MQRLLQDADRHILSLAGGSHYPLYCYLRITAAALAPLDSFYIGLCDPESRTVVYPYNFDGREYDDPNVNTYSPDGVTQWILSHARPYWSRDDDGALLHRGRPFGDTSRRSEEAIVVPLFDARQGGRERTRAKRRVIGLVAMLSYQPNAFTSETVFGLECLAESLSVAFLREREDEERRRRRSGLPSHSAPMGVPSSSAIVDSVGERLKCIRRKAEALRSAQTASPELEDLIRECEAAQTELWETVLRDAAQPPSPLAALTPREAEIAALLAEGKTNRQIADRLFISETTAKTHCASIIRKLNAGGRSGVAQIVRPYLPTTLRSEGASLVPRE